MSAIEAFAAADTAGREYARCLRASRAAQRILCAHPLCPMALESAIEAFQAQEDAWEDLQIAQRRLAEVTTN